ncbi:tryptophan synthase beta subunit-like PLP-dependent enzyme [Geopyxis carbonaria]|nr:tryptophan synthase beta subunit-like PLP-dependent enzyme [Geopyxis carbonaria]
MSATPQPLTPASVAAAHALIAPHIHATPLLTSSTLSSLATAALSLPVPVSLHFKPEHTQLVGAFKIRGATHALLRLSPAERAVGVITHSSGNHAQALALAARTLGISARVVMPAVSTPSKVAATRGYGADVVFSGSSAAEREAKVEEVREGRTLVPPYDHPDIIVGQGTMGFEMLRDCPELEVVVAPCGGGGMLAGIGVALDGRGVRVYGAEPRQGGADDACRGLERGERVTAVGGPGTGALSIADGLRTPVGVWNWGVISDKSRVKGVYSVSEEQIKDAMRLVVERMKCVVEPSAVVGLAVVLYSEKFREEMGRVFGKRKVEEGEVRIGVVLSGGNTTIDKIVEIFGKDS